MSRYKDKELLKKRQEQAYKYFIEKGYTPAQSSGIIGNLMQESKLNPGVTSTMKNENSFGIAQWNPAAAAGNRLGKLKQFAKKKGSSHSDFKTQLDFIHHELNNVRHLGNDKLKKAKTVEEAAEIFSNYYERPNKKYAHIDNRINYGKSVFAMFNDNNIYAKDERGQTVVMNPEVATEEDIKNSEAIKQKFYLDEIPMEGEQKQEQVANIPPQVEQAKQEIEQSKKEVQFKNQLTKTLQALNQRGEAPKKTPRVAEFKTQDIRVGENEFFKDIMPQFEEGGKVDPPTEKEKALRKAESTNVAKPSNYDFSNLSKGKEIDVSLDDIFKKVSEEEPSIDLDNLEGRFKVKDERQEAVKTASSTAVKTPAVQKITKEVEVKEEAPDDLVEEVVSKKGINKPLNEIDLNNISKSEVIALQETMVDEGIMEVQIETPKTKKEVIEVQKRLTDLGYDLGDYGENKDGVDGKLGPKTRAALNKHNKGLTKIDGKVGKVTRNAFKEYKEVGSRFFELESDEDLVKYQSNLESQGYFSGIDADLATEEDLQVRTKIVPQNPGGLKSIKNTAKNIIFGVEEEGREAPTCSFEPIPGQKSNDSRCTAFVGDEIEKSVGVDGRIAAGAYGNAWQVSSNIIDSGGEELFSVFEDKKPKLQSNEIEPYIKEKVSNNIQNLNPNSMAQGDIVNLFYEGSTHKDDAYKEGGKYFTTHTGIVKVDSKGNKYIEHNVNGNVSKENIQDLIDGKVKHSGKDISITAVVRPNYSKTYYDSSEASVNEDNVEDFADIGSKNAALFTQTIVKNKDKLIKDIPIDESEFNSLTKAAKIIGWRETDYKDFHPVQAIKNIGANIREWGGGTERSMGVTRMKDQKNLTPNLRKKYIKGRGENLHNPKEAAIPSFYALSSRYIYLRDLNKKNDLDLSKDELTQLSILGWNEDIAKVGKSLKKYKSFEKTMEAYNTNKETGEMEEHPYSLALEGYNNYLK